MYFWENFCIKLLASLAYRFNEEGDHAEELSTELAPHDIICEITARLRGIIKLYHKSSHATYT